MAEPFRFTTGRWFNKPRDDGDFAKAPAYREGFTYEGFAYGQDYPEHFAPPAGAPGGLQVSLICSKSAQFLAIDVDYPEHLAGNATGALVSGGDAISVRGGHFHLGVDMRGVKDEDWPVQGRTAWGDVKAAGFIPLPGSVHKSGALYEASPGWASRLLKPSPELLEALRADRGEHALRRLADARQRLGLSAATRLPDGSYLYASGYAGGTWEQLIGAGALLYHDDELKDLVWDMHVEYGRPEAECREAWEKLAGALGSPWTERDWQRHWHRVPARRAEKLENDDATRLEEDFGLRLPATPLEGAVAEQQQAYSRRAELGRGFGPPTPPQPDGAYEDAADGISWFHVYLGATPESPPFDAGAPTDAGNAEAVLFRAAGALRYDEEAGTWLKRAAGRWVQDDGAAKEAVTELRKKLPEGCADPLKHPRYEHLDPEEDAAEIAALKRHAQNAGRFSSSAAVSSIAAMMENIARARSQPWMTVRDSATDADPEVLWAGGVPWDLKACACGMPEGRHVPVAGQCGPVRAWRTDRGQPHLHSAAVVPDASVDTPVWDQLMREVWVERQGGAHDPWLAQWALLVLSAGVTGYPRKAVPLLKGGTDRGKSTVIDAMADVLGTYFRPLNSKILDAAASTHDTVLMELKGTRLTFLDEGIQRGKVATARLKRLVGGSSITANRMRQDPVTFRPTHTLAITLNPEESFSFDDPAVDSRIRLLPCNGDPGRVIAVAKLLNYYASPAWLAERPGVLARLMYAAAVLLNDPHALDKDRAPLSVQRAEQEVKDEEDDVLRWFMEATTDCPEGYPSRELFIAFREWTRETKGDRGFIPSETKWGRRMNELVPEDVQSTLYTRNKSRLRRRRPAPPGAGGFGGSPAPLAGLSAMGFASQASSTVVDVQKMSEPGESNPPAEPNPPANPPAALTRGDSAFTVSSVGTVGRSQSKNIEKQDPPPLIQLLENGTGQTHRRTVPTGRASGEDPAAGLKKDNWLENTENGQNSQNGSSPPVAKTPRNRLTEQEKAERAAARKARLAAERAQARRDKIAELGGPLVTLPAVVLRDQRILPVTPAQAAAWLEPMLGELSVDVEHSGFPLGHPEHRLRLVQLGNEHSAVVFDPSDPEQAEVARVALRAAERLHAHSAHADLIPLEHAGLCDATAWDKMHDTVLLAKLSDPALCGSEEAGLKALARAMLGDDYALSWRAEKLKNEIFAAGGWLIECEVTTPAERSGWAMIPLCEAFVRYSAADVLDCSAVARKLQE